MRSRYLRALFTSGMSRSTGHFDTRVGWMFITCFLRYSRQQICQFYLGCTHYSLRAVLLIADQAIRPVKYTHEKGSLHCDIKPNNFLLGVGNNGNILYTIEFGLARNMDVGKGHRIYQTTNLLEALLGTPASIITRDSVGYIQQLQRLYSNGKQNKLGAII